MHAHLPVTLRSNAGVSLIEVMISLLLLSVAIAGLAVGFPVSRTAVQTSSQVSVAISLARQTLEDMRNREYTSAVDQITTANFPNQGYGTIVNFPKHRRSVDIQNGVPVAVCVPPPGTPCMKTVTVTVFYRDDKGLERGIPLTSIFIR
jgi:prepilin-type N-terminal cleavage/methylation domain-containing protein